MCYFTDSVIQIEQIFQNWKAIYHIYTFKQESIDEQIRSDKKISGNEMRSFNMFYVSVSGWRQLKPKPYRMIEMNTSIVKTSRI